MITHPGTAAHAGMHGMTAARGAEAGGGQAFEAALDAAGPEARTGPAPTPHHAAVGSVAAASRPAAGGDARVHDPVAIAAVPSAPALLPPAAGAASRPTGPGSETKTPKGSESTRGRRDAAGPQAATSSLPMPPASVAAPTAAPLPAGNATGDDASPVGAEAAPFADGGRAPPAAPRDTRLPGRTSADAGGPDGATPEATGGRTPIGPGPGPVSPAPGAPSPTEPAGGGSAPSVTPLAAPMVDATSAGPASPTPPTVASTATRAPAAPPPGPRGDADADAPDRVAIVSIERPGSQAAPLAVRLTHATLGTIEVHVPHGDAPASGVAIVVDRSETLRSMMTDHGSLRAMLDQAGCAGDRIVSFSLEERMAQPLPDAPSASTAGFDEAPSDRGRENGSGERRRDDEALVRGAGSDAAANEPAIALGARTRRGSVVASIDITA